MIFHTIMLWVIGPPLAVAIFLLILISLPFDRSGNLIHSIGALWLKMVLFLAGVDVEVKGLEKIPRGPIILAPNHRASFDIPILQANIPIQFRWIAKKSLFRIPVFGWSMSLAGYISIDKDYAGRAYRSIEQAAERIKTGTSVLIFPEGRRSYMERLLPFKRGIFMLASMSGAPIVPIAICGTENIVGKWNIFLRPTSVKLAIGDPIETKGVGEQELKEKTRRAIEALMEALREGLHGGR